MALKRNMTGDEIVEFIDKELLPQARLEIGKKKIFENVGYLQVLKSPSFKHYYFPIGIDCLYEDFVNAVESYKDKLKNTKSLQRKWRTTVNAICKPR